MRSKQDLSFGHPSAKFFETAVRPAAVPTDTGCHGPARACHAASLHRTHPWVVGSLWLAGCPHIARVLEMPVLPDGPPKQLRTRTGLQEARGHHVLAIDSLVCEGTRNVACAMSASECKTRAPQDMIMMSLFLLPKEELG